MAERTYRIHVAAEMSGVSEGLIRAWERRYGALRPRRTSSGYRAYTELDILILKRLKMLTAEGVSIAEAVKLLPQVRKDAKADLEKDLTERKVPLAAQLDEWRQEALEAAGRMDQHRIEDVLDEAMASLPPVTFFTEVLAPLQREVGERWHAGTLTVAEEHLITQAARQRVMTLLHNAPKRARKHAVAACFPDEDHELGLMGAALRFRHAGWRVTFLGARTSAQELRRVVTALPPDLVALSAVMDPGAEAFRTNLTSLLEVLPSTARVAVGGWGAQQHAAVVAELGCITATTDEAWESLLAA